MRRLMARLTCVVVVLTIAACAEERASDWIIGSWVIDRAAQREETARVSPSELEDFEDAFRANLLPIRETFHRDGRYEVTHATGESVDDRWEVVSRTENSVTIRSSGHSWIARAANFASTAPSRSPSELTYTDTDQNHMYVTLVMPIFGEEKEISYFFVRDE